MKHRLSQFFDADIFTFMTNSDVVSDSIILNHRGVIDGNVSNPLFEVRDRIAANAHHFLNQDVGIRYRRLGLIDKPRLSVLPGVRKFSSLLVTKRFDVQFIDPLLSLPQDLLALSRVSFRSRCAVVFRTELRSQLLCPFFARVDPNANCNRDDYSYREKRNNNYC